MATFPKIHTDAITAKYPIGRTNRLLGAVNVFVDGSEQRYAKGIALAEFDLTFRGVSPADKDTLRTFYLERQGSTDTTWDWTFDGQQYIDCYFLGVLEAIQTGPLKWDIKFRFKGRPAPPAP